MQNNLLYLFLFWCTSLKDQQGRHWQGRLFWLFNFSYFAFNHYVAGLPRNDIVIQSTKSCNLATSNILVYSALLLRLQAEWRPQSFPESFFSLKCETILLPFLRKAADPQNAQTVLFEWKLKRRCRESISNWLLYSCLHPTATWERCKNVKFEEKSKFWNLSSKWPPL